MPPQFTVNGFPLGALAAMAGLWGFVVMVFWMICGWRAMRAHERLSDAVERLARK